MEDEKNEREEKNEPQGKRRKVEQEEEHSRNLNDYYEPFKYHSSTSDQEAHLFKWFESNGYSIPSTHNRSSLTKKQQHILKDCPHPRITSFIGGCFHFPYSRREEMLQELANEISEDVPMYWNQIAYDKDGEGSRLVIDIDSDGRVVDDTSLFYMARVLWTTLQEYFKNSRIDIFVSKCGPRVKKGKLCTGIHFTCHVKVSFLQARQITLGYGLRLKKEPQIDMTGLTVDAGIYKEESKQVSIRMIYSRKLEECPVCKGHQHMICSFCDGRGRVSTKKTYEPFCCINGATGKDDVKYYQEKCPDFFHIVKCYSIWPEPKDSTHEYEKPPGDPIVEQKDKEPVKIAVGLTRRMKKIHSGDSVYELVEEFIQGIVYNGKKLWPRSDVTKISLSEKQHTALIVISGLDSSHCPYAMKDHGGNRIYFKVVKSQRKMTVLCHSDKSSYGCKTQDPIAFDVPMSILSKIFGDTVVNPWSSSKQTSQLDFESFTKQQSTRPKSLAEIRKHDSERKKENRLKYIMNEYKLNSK